ncbi:MAG: ABC transporter substrate-binding protein [Solirubrobacteraceae bacterium]
MRRSIGARNSSPGQSSQRFAPRVVALVAPLILGVFLAACGGSSNSSSGSTSSGQSAGTPVRGGVLSFARSEDADVGLNPINAPSNGSIFIITQIFDQLVEMGQGSEVEPGLAASWEKSADGLSWTFHLREASFSNGEPVTAEDVKFSIERFANPKINVSYPALGEAIKDVQVVDPHTVIIHLKHVNGALLDDVAMFASSIEPKTVVEKIGDKAFSEHPVGSGPFMVSEYKRGQKTVLVRNPHYWRTGEPLLNGVTFEFVPDANTRVLKLRSGEADVANAIPYNQVASLNGTEGVTVEVAKALSWQSIFLNTTKPPLGDSKVRQALNYATPKEQILKTVLYGNAQIANSMIPPLKYWDASIKAYPFELEKAKKLMSESSAPNGFKLELLIPSGDPVEQQIAEVLKAEWAKIGVNVDIVQRELGALESGWFEGKGGMAATFEGGTLSSDTLSDDEIAGLTLNPAAGLHSLGTYYNNPKVNQLLSDAGGTLSEEKRAKDFSEVQQIAMEDAPAVPLFFTKTVTGVRSNVKDFQTYPIGWWPLRQVWLAK